jgi:hypothetical protein
MAEPRRHVLVDIHFDAAAGWQRSDVPQINRGLFAFETNQTLSSLSFPLPLLCGQ